MYAFLGFLGSVPNSVGSPV